MIVLNVGKRNRHVGITINNNNNNNNIIINDANSIGDQDKEHNLLCRNCYKKKWKPTCYIHAVQEESILGLVDNALPDSVQIADSDCGECQLTFVYDADGCRGIEGKVIVKYSVAVEEESYQRSQCYEYPKQLFDQSYGRREKDDSEQSFSCMIKYNTGFISLFATPPPPPKVNSLIRKFTIGGCMQYSIGATSYIKFWVGLPRWLCGLGNTPLIASCFSTQLRLESLLGHEVKLPVCNKVMLLE